MSNLQRWRHCYVLGYHDDTHHGNTRTGIVSAIMKISRLMPYCLAASEQTFPKGNTIGKKQCSLLALDAMWMPFPLLTNHPMGRTLVCTTPAVLCVQKATMINDLPHSSTHVQVVSCHLMYSPYSLYQPIGYFNLMTSLSSSISGGLWAKFILYFVALHHVMCMRTKYIGGIVKPLMFPPTSDSRSGSGILGLNISQRRL